MNPKNNTANGETNNVPDITIKYGITIIIICPPVILANKRIARAKALLNHVINSNTHIIGIKGKGSPLGTKLVQYFIMPFFLIPAKI